ncbi:MAG: hypothetical protein ACRER8_22250 [Pseudomonas sp.]|uniref:hypothetical protein n=1 Tax=Pseudomonas sp. TaxID=306 RepID=UPI003D6F8A14
MYDITNNHYVCSAAMPVCVGGQIKPAREWALIHGIKWQTLKMRRYRGLGWNEVFGVVRRGRPPAKQVA